MLDKTMTAEKYPILKGVPIPKMNRGRKAEPDSFMGALRRMEIGDCVCHGESSLKAIQIVSAAWRTLKKHDPQMRSKKFTSRTVEGKLYVWRMA